MSTARDRPPEEAPEDTSFARGLRVFLAIADRGRVRADEPIGSRSVVHYYRLTQGAAQLVCESADEHIQYPSRGGGDDDPDRLARISLGEPL